MMLFQSQTDWYRAKTKELNHYSRIFLNERMNRFVNDAHYRANEIFKRLKPISEVIPAPTRPEVYMSYPKHTPNQEIIDKLQSIKSKLVELRDR